jgi:hypothetical protein
MARLYANENFPLPVVTELRRLGHDVLTVAETGKAEQRWPDDAVLAFAHGEGRTLLTLNRKHFIRLHAQGALHAGIVACTVDPDFVGQAQRIHAVLGANNDLTGQLLRINRPNR